MKNKITLRSLISLSFLLFFLPFLKTCSNAHRAEIVETVVVDSPNTIIKENDTGHAFKKLSQKQESEALVRDENIQITNKKESLTYSFYGLLKNTLGNGEFDSNPFSDKTFYPLLGFLVVLILTIVMLGLSFAHKIQTVKKLSVINLILLATSTILLYFCEVLEAIDQIKIGYNLIIINFILIIIFCRKVLKENPIA